MLVLRVHFCAQAIIQAQLRFVQSLSLSLSRSLPPSLFAFLLVDALHDAATAGKEATQAIQAEARRGTTVFLYPS